ncbi:MAG: NAD(P)/FAD-dependent oxidoreductase, partial [Eggerthellaceae bacterium]|nr:NAD(P)/FAD-dependent oxidoreductase [Eggerthellaceae bacterium]
MKEHDVIVIGGGHNGLIVAAYLAKAGVDVCVCEALGEVGGDIVTNELTLPGFKHDRGATMHGVIQGNPLMLNDELGLKSKYGLKYIYPELSFATTFPDGTAICSYVDIDKTCASIEKTCGKKDAEAYRALYRALSPATAFINAGSFAEPPSFGAMMAQFDSNPIGRDVVQSMFKSAYEVALEWFDDPKMIMHVTKMCTEMFFNPEDKGTAFYLYMLLPAAHMAPYAMPVGGSGELSNALARCIEDLGGTIMLNAPVKQILTSQDRATGVVLASGEQIKARKRVVSSVDPRLMFGKGRMIEDALDPQVQRKIDAIADPF